MACPCNKDNSCSCATTNVCKCEKNDCSCESCPQKKEHKSDCACKKSGKGNMSFEHNADAAKPASAKRLYASQKYPIEE